MLGLLARLRLKRKRREEERNRKAMIIQYWMRSKGVDETLPEALSYVDEIERRGYSDDVISRVKDKAEAQMKKEGVAV